MSDLRLGEGREFELIARMRERWGALAAGIGDDAAVLRVPRGERVVVSTDASIEDVHFRRAWLSPREIGYRAVTAALSDLAAMAAAPVGILVALEISDQSAGELLAIADGIGDAARAAQTVVVGGNLARGPKLGITTTVVGAAFAPLARSGARPGDVLYVTGALGGPRAALRALESGARPAAELRERFVHPSARIGEARWLAARGAVAAVDISDGLCADAGHLAAASDVAIEIDADRLPVFPGANRDDALASGEEYELIVAARSDADLPESEFSERFGIPLTQIGRVLAGSAGVHVVQNGRRVAAPMGYDHFSR